MSSDDNAQKTAECVQNSIVEIVRGSIHGEDVRDRAFITVIRYGRKNQPVNIIRQGGLVNGQKMYLRPNI